MSNTSNNLNLDGSAFDLHAKQLHASAVASLSPQTLAKLRSARHNATQPKPAKHWRWLMAGSVPAVLAVAFGLQLLPQQPSPNIPTSTNHVAIAATDNDDLIASLDESPELYLWLASSDAQRLALE